MKNFIIIFLLLPFALYSSLLESDYGARPLSLGGSYVAVGNDPVAIFWNPAGMPEPKYGIVTLGYQMKFADMKNYEFFGSSKEFLQGYWGLGLVVWTAEEAGYDDLNEFTSMLKANEILIGASYKRSFFGILSAGATLKISHSKIVDSSATALALDIGARSVIQGIGIGFVIKNIGIGTEQIPMGMVLGGYYTFFRSSDKLHSISATADLASVQNIGFNLKIGAEYSFRNIAFFRLGYTTVPSGELGFTSKFRTGISFQYYGVDLSYTLEPFGQLGFTHEINLTYKIDTAFEKRLKDITPPEINFSADNSLISVKNGLEKIKFKIEIKDDNGIDKWGFYIEQDGKVVYKEEETGLENVKFVTKEIEWKGIDYNNKKLKDGKYRAIVRVSDIGENLNASSIDKIFISEDDYDVVLDCNKTVIKEKDKIEFSLLKPIKIAQKAWRLIIKDKDGAIIREIKGSGIFKNAIWDGKDAQNLPVLPEKYFAQLEITFGNNVVKPSNIIEIEVK